MCEAPFYLSLEYRMSNVFMQPVGSESKGSAYGALYNNLLYIIKAIHVYADADDSGNHPPNTAR